MIQIGDGSGYINMASKLLMNIYNRQTCSSICIGVF